MDEETAGRWLYAIGKHLSQFAESLTMTYVDATRTVARECDLLLKLRRLGSVTATRAFGFGRVAGLAPRQTTKTLEELQPTGLVELLYEDDRLLAVRERILTEAVIFRVVWQRFDNFAPEGAERAMVPALDLLSRLPLTEGEAIDRLALEGHDEHDVRRALELHEAFSLLKRRSVPDMGVTLLYNEYLWGARIDHLELILARLGRRETDYLLALMEEARGAQGRALERLTAAPPHIVSMAANTGILDAVTITTASGRNKSFSFTPHFHGYRAGPAPRVSLDTSDMVKLFIASMQYAVRYSEDFKLRDPLRFIDVLLDCGTAGNATPIGRDYVLLEQQGIVETIPTVGDKARFILRKEDVVREARSLMGDKDFGGAGDNDVRSLVEQRGFRSPEEHRVRAALGEQAMSSPDVEHDLIASIREAANRGQW